MNQGSDGNMRLPYRAWVQLPGGRVGRVGAYGHGCVRVDGLPSHPYFVWVDEDLVTDVGPERGLALFEAWALVDALWPGPPSGLVGAPEPAIAGFTIKEPAPIPFRPRRRSRAQERSNARHGQIA